jgi:hypothetical protein
MSHGPDLPFLGQIGDDFAYVRKWTYSLASLQLIPMGTMLLGMRWTSWSEKLEVSSASPLTSKDPI